MTTIEIGDSKVLVYSSIKELPVDLSKKMHSYLLQDMGIGSTINDIDEHLAKIQLFIHSDKKEEALEEAKNLRFNMVMALNEARFDAPAFACLIHSVDERKVEDRSVEGLNKLISELSDKGLTNDMLENALDGVKKNLILNENFIFLNSLETT